MGYLGSKGGSGVWQAIVALMPPHDTYIETHLGSGVVMRAKPRAARQIGIDVSRAALQLAARELADDARLILPPAPAIELYQADAVGFLEDFGFAAAGRVLIYADPPYVRATRTAADRHHYGAFDYSDDDHRRLIAILRNIPAAVILSGYPSALYDELVGDWRSVELQAMTRGGPRTEKIWLNFPEGQVQWASLAGRDYVDRQRIKRKRDRWVCMWRRLSPGERLALLAALLEVPAGPEGACREPDCHTRRPGRTCACASRSAGETPASGPPGAATSPKTRASMPSTPQTPATMLAGVADADPTDAGGCAGSRAL